jgi:hypothetical protein
MAEAISRWYHLVALLKQSPSPPRETLSATIQPNSTTPRIVIVTKDDKTSVVSFHLDHTTSATNTSHKQQVQLSLNEHIFSPKENPNTPHYALPLKRSSTSSATTTMLRKNNIL